jgi:NADPH2:quinone reductase
MTAESLTVPALVVPRTGGSDVLTVEDREVPAPGPSQVRVKVAAAGVNFIDIYQREGVYRMSTPFVVGGEGAGTVEAVGEGVDFSIGDRVAWAQGPGSAAGAVLLEADSVVRVPDRVDLETAAAVMLQGITGHYLVNSTYAVQPRDLVLAHAVAGGVGQLLVQLVKAKGATLIGTAGSAEKVKLGLELGADHVVDYTELSEMGELTGRVKELTGGRGVDVVYDGVGQTTFDASLASLRPRGMMVLYGASSGPVPPFEIQRLNRGGSLFLTRPTMGNYIATREELVWRTSEILGGVADGSLKVSVGGRYPIAEAKAAYDALAGRQTTGKLLLLP